MSDHACGMEERMDAVGMSLVYFGAPLTYYEKRRTMDVLPAIAGGALLARSDATLLSVMPVVIVKNRASLLLSPLELKHECEAIDAEAEMGMLLDLTASMTGDAVLAELSSAFKVKDVPEYFLHSDNTSDSRRTLADMRTPDVIRRHGFMVNATLEDFMGRIDKFAPSAVVR